MKMTYNTYQNEPITMTIKVIAECTACKNKTTLYVDETAKNQIVRTCPDCGNNIYKIVYRC